jgi:hypothetical protein
MVDRIGQGGLPVAELKVQLTAPVVVSELLEFKSRTSEISELSC